MLRVSLDRFLARHNLTTYRLMKETEGRVARGSVYALARGGEVKRVDLETLGEVMSALSRLTGETVTPNDLLEVVRPPADADAHSLAHLAPKQRQAFDEKNLKTFEFRGRARGTANGTPINQIVSELRGER